MMKAWLSVIDNDSVRVIDCFTKLHELLDSRSDPHNWDAQFELGARFGLLGRVCDHKKTLLGWVRKQCWLQESSTARVQVTSTASTSFMPMRQKQIKHIHQPEQDYLQWEQRERYQLMVQSATNNKNTRAMCYLAHAYLHTKSKLIALCVGFSVIFHYLLLNRTKRYEVE